MIVYLILIGKKIKQLEIFMNGRHWNIVYLSYESLGIPPNLRCNIDWVFILRENIVSNRKRLYDNYTGMFPTLKCFVQLWINVLIIVNV